MQLATALYNNAIPCWAGQGPQPREGGSYISSQTHRALTSHGGCAHCSAPGASPMSVVVRTRSRVYVTECHPGCFIIQGRFLTS
jgi:hypothetical protein